VQHARKFAYLAVCLGGLAAAGLAVADQTRWAVAALGLALAGVPVLLLLLSRSLAALPQQLANQNKARVREQVQLAKQLTALDALVRKVSAAQSAQDPATALTRLDRRTSQLQTRINSLAQNLESVASETVNLGRMQDRVAPETTMPVLGGWAATNRTIGVLVDTVLSAETDPHVVECGSGSSTVWVAAAMQKRGGGHVTALEHEAEYAEKTRAELRRRGLDSYATVIDAPLTQLPAGEDGRIWYDTSAISGLAPIDLLFVDGPPATTGDEARRPAFDEFAALLNPGGLVVLDDTNRGEEKRIVEDWTSRAVAGRSLAVREHVGRATLLDVAAKA